MNEISSRDSQIQSLKDEIDTLKESSLKISQVAQLKDGQINQLTIHSDLLNQRINDLMQEIRDLNDKLITEQSKSIPIEYKYKDLSNENESLEKHSQWLQQQLKAKEDELINIKTQFRQNINALELKINSSLNENSILENSNSSLKKELQEKTILLNELSEKLKEERFERNSLQTSFQEEVLSKERVIQLLKSSVQDLKEKSSEQSEKLTNEIQKLRHESEINNNRIQEWIDKCNKANDEVAQLQVELNKKQKEFELSMSPSESIKALLVSGLKSSELCDKLVQITQELVQTKAEKERLKSSLDDILRELETKKPLFQEQKEDYERLTSSYILQSNKLQQALRDKNELEQIVDKLNKKAAKVDQLIVENDSLSTQVSHLLRECMDYKKKIGQESSTTLTSALDEANYNDTELRDYIVSKPIINEDLVTFSDITQLQEKNRSLIREVQQLKYEKELSNQELSSRLSSNFDSQLNIALSELESLKADRLSLQSQLKTLKKERDMLRSMVAELEMDLRNKDHNRQDNKVDSNVHITIKELKDIQTEYFKSRQMLQEELDSEKKGRYTAESLSQRLEAQYDDLKSRLEMKEQHINRITLELNEEKSSKSKLVEKLLSIQDSLTITYKKLEEKESQISNQLKENSLLKANLDYSKERNNSLLEELSSFESYKKAQETLTSQLLEIQSKLETQFLQEKEIVLTLKEREKDHIKLSESQINSLNNRIKEIENKFASEKDDLTQEISRKNESLKNIEEEKIKLIVEKDSLLKKVEDLSNKLKESETRLTMLISQYTAIDDLDTNDSNDQSVEKNSNNLRITLSAYKQEVEVKEEMIRQLKSTIETSNQLTKEKEDQLLQLTELFDKFKEQMNAKVSELESRNDSLQKKALDLNEELTKSTNEILEIREKHQTQQEELQRNLEFSSIENSSSISEERISKLKKDLEEEHKQFVELKKKYESEIIAHGETMSKLVNIEEEVQKYRDDPKLTKNIEKELNTLKIEKESLISEKASLEDKISDFSKRIEFEEAQKNSLFSEIEKLSNQIKTLQENKQYTEDESDKNQRVHNLHEVVRHLRRENEILQSQSISDEKKYKRLNLQYETIKAALEEKQREIQELYSKSPSTSEEEYNARNKLINELSLYKESNITLRSQYNDIKAKYDSLILEKETSQINLLKSITQIEQLENTIRNKDKEIDQKNKAIQIWSQRVESLLQKDSRIDPEEFETLKSEKSNLETTNSQLLTEVSKLKEEISSLQSIKETSDSFKQLSRKYKEKNEALETKLKTNEKTISELSESEQKNTKIIKELNEKISKSQIDIEKRNEALKKMKDLHLKLKNNMESLEEENETLEEENNNLKSEIEKLKSKDTEVETQQEIEPDVTEAIDVPQEEESLKRKLSDDSIPENIERPSKKPRLSENEDEGEIDVSVTQVEEEESVLEDEEIEKEHEKSLSKEEDLSKTALDISNIDEMEEEEEDYAESDSASRKTRDDGDLEEEEEELSDSGSDLLFDDSRPIILTTQSIKDNERKSPKEKGARVRKIQRPSFKK